MTHPDFRALCAELAGCLDDALTFTVSGDTERSMRLLINRARAALSAPQQGAPSDEDLTRTYQNAYEPAWQRGEVFGCHIDGLRAVLTRYAPQAVPVAPSSICTGCDTPRHEAITAIANGAMACCPDCSTLTVEDRNAIRAIKAVPVADAVAAERARWFKAVEWVLGTGDSDFTPPDAPHGRYWWREGLAEQCGIRWDGAKWVDAEALPLPEAPHD